MTLSVVRPVANRVEAAPLGLEVAADAAHGTVAADKIAPVLARALCGK